MSSQDRCIILWFRQDLRIQDLPALEAAANDGARVLPVYILDEDDDPWSSGGASRWWLHHSLTSLGEQIRSLGGELILRAGDTQRVLAELCAETGAGTVHCSRRYEPFHSAREIALHESLGQQNITLKRFPGALLHEPGSVLTGSDMPYRVFTPFWRACCARPVAPPLPASTYLWSAPVRSDDLDSWNLRPHAPDWAEGWEKQWTPGTDGALVRLRGFLDGAVQQYGTDRDLPGVAGTSKLSPHLHFGEISPRQVWAFCEEHQAHFGNQADGVRKFLSEIGWREFSYHLLHFFPTIPDTSFNPRFEAFPWEANPEHLRAWQRGSTGYPIVDAGMRELWHTGHMHNRVRMIVASFLCKHLRIDWRAGEAWFWDTLVDADLASNSCSWQWVAGSGADAAPYFRIFNPMTQGEKFDKAGTYVRRWVPEIAAVPDKFLHKPWEAPSEILKAVGVTLGETYPEPIVDHKEARARALDAYEVVKASAATA